MDRSKLRNDLLVDEGYKLTAYRDTAGFWTIGVGHLLGSTARMTSITPRECDALLNADVDDAIIDCGTVFGAQQFGMLNPGRQRALVNMMFNRGLRHVQESTRITPAIKAAMAPDAPANAWEAVADAIKGSPWANQIGSRADRIADLLEKGADA